MKKIFSLILVICILSLALVSCTSKSLSGGFGGALGGDSSEDGNDKPENNDTANLSDSEKYELAFAYIAERRYSEARALFIELGDYKDSVKQLSYFRFVVSEVLSTEEEFENGEITSASSETLSTKYNEFNLPEKYEFVLEADSYSNTGFFEFFYDEDNNLIKVIEASSADEDIEEYDAAGNLIKATYIEYNLGDDGEKIIDEKSVYEYTYTDGAVSSVSYVCYKYTSDGNEVVSEEYTTAYDKNGNVTASSRVNYKNGVISYETVYTAAYNENGRPVTLSRTVNNYDRSGTYTYSTEEFCSYVYDGNGILVSASKDYASRDGNSSYAYTYEHDANGNITKSTRILSTEEHDTRHKLVTEFVYGEDGLLATETRYDYDYYEAGEVPSSYEKEVIEYQYDKAAGIEKRTTTHYNKSGKATRKYENTEKYDENGDMIANTKINYSYTTDGVLLMASSLSWEYVYDKNGNEIKYSYISKEFDKNGEISYMYGYSTEREYSEDGKFLSEKFYDENGVLVEITTPTYDENGCLVKIEGSSEEYHYIAEYTYKLVYIPFELSDIIEEYLSYFEPGTAARGDGPSDNNFSNGDVYPTVSYH